MPMKEIPMRSHYMRLHVLAICLFCAAAFGSSYAQGAKIMIETIKCDKGKITHPIHLRVSVFDAEKIPEIVSVEQDLRAALATVNSDPNAIQKAENLYSKLQNLVGGARAIARTQSLPKSGYVFDIPSVRKVVVFAFETGEFESFTYAKQEVKISPGATNTAVLNFSSEEDCKEAKEL
jgi:hypothetical protein